MLIKMGVNAKTTSRRYRIKKYFKINLNAKLRKDVK